MSKEKNNEQFKEFFICPHCKSALYEKEVLEKLRRNESDTIKYCQYCRRYIGDNYNEAILNSKTHNSEILLKRTLEHYELPNTDELGYVFIVENSENVIERYRLDLHGLNEYKKFRTTIYCDSEYDKFIILKSPV